MKASKSIYSVTERVGNFSHTLEEFETRDEAVEFMLDRVNEDTQEEFICHRTEVPEHEWDEVWENALSYYSIEKWEV